MAGKNAMRLALWPFVLFTQYTHTHLQCSIHFKYIQYIFIRQIIKFLDCCAKVFRIASSAQHITTRRTAQGSAKVGAIKDNKRKKAAHCRKCRSKDGSADITTNIHFRIATHTHTQKNLRCYNNLQTADNSPSHYVCALMELVSFGCYARKWVYCHG